MYEISSLTETVSVDFVSLLLLDEIANVLSLVHSCSKKQQFMGGFKLKIKFYPQGNIFISLVLSPLTFYLL